MGVLTEFSLGRSTASVTGIMAGAEAGSGAGAGLACCTSGPNECGWLEPPRLTCASREIALGNNFS